MDVSIVIVNWNTRDILKDCLNSVYEQSQDIKFEVIVIDNNSGDGSAEMVKEEFPQVILIQNKENKGFATANNQGVKVSSGRYILLLNSDTIILDNAIAKVVSFSDDHPDAVVVGCRVLNLDGSIQHTCSMFPSLANKLLFLTFLYRLFPNSRFFGRERMTWWCRDTVMEVDVVTGCFMLVRHDAIRQVGLMDEQFFMYAEEVDWCYRFRQAGWKNLFTPEGEIIHLGGASAAKYGPNRALLKDASTIRLMFKHWPKWKAFLGCILMFCFYLSRLAIMLPMCALRPRKNTFIRIKNHLTGLQYLLGVGRYLDKGQLRPGTKVSVSGDQ